MKPLHGWCILTLLIVALPSNRGRGQDATPPPDNGPATDAGPPQGDSGSGGDQGVSYQTFYDSLASQGTWIQTPDYGYVFQPTVTDPNWAPYTDGYWVSTDVGWMWISDEPWAWATYHYGRWDFIDGTGWVWAPGYEWAPAWVSWRYGDGYAGWAPLPFDAVYGYRYGYGRDWGYWHRDRYGDRGYHLGHDVDEHFHIGSERYNFVRSDRLGESNLHGEILDRSRNSEFIGHTANITNLNVGKGFGAHDGDPSFRGVSAGGPPLNEVNAHATHPVQSLHVSSQNTPGHSTVSGDSVSTYAPHMKTAGAEGVHPSVVGRSIDHTNFGRTTSVAGFSHSNAVGDHAAASHFAESHPGATNFHPQVHSFAQANPSGAAGHENFHPGNVSDHQAGGFSASHPGGGFGASHPSSSGQGFSAFHPQSTGGQHFGGGGGFHPAATHSAPSHSGGGGGGGGRKK